MSVCVFVLQVCCECLPNNVLASDEMRGELESSGLPDGEL